MSTPPPSPYQPPQGQPGQVPPPPPAYPQAGQQQPGQQQWGYSAPAAPQGQQESPKNIVAGLFDWRFQNLITPTLVRWLYPLLIGVGVLYWLIFLFAAFAGEPVMGVLVLLLGPVFLMVYVAFVRLMFELYFAVVRMSEDINRGQGQPRN